MRKVLIMGFTAIAMSVAAPAAYADGYGLDPNGGAHMTAGSGFFDYLASLLGWKDDGCSLDPNGCRQ
ncbi:hypothetical protein FPZ24_03775 [Sphingomonas panacisoli]|uniref:Uncharacterized protein n=1 Tax=Sphingomonas panacisoli TaxID=1813879 RepID=A0A5B8LG18_9SPHN|nr:hypothetical protein [Sphingomonas panacisoli]QDZ06705.1 hypothetical protein FPZ24_03775 [Sphingomonas panacisoli]